jgi:uncharacterized protein YbjT (DUF2867 family)
LHTRARIDPTDPRPPARRPPRQETSSMKLPALLAALTLAVLASPSPAAEAAARSPAAATADRTVLVIGATGRSGAPTLAALRAAGYTRVRALVRDPASARAKVPAEVELVQGDVRDPASLAAALAGVQYIVSTLGSNTFNDPANSPEKVDYEGVRNVATAAKAAGVTHYVQVSSLGVTNPNHPLNRFGKVMDWKLKGENALRASGVPYTIVRPGGLGDGPGGKVGLRVGQGDTMDSGQIQRADVATVCVQALGNPDAYGKTFEVIGGAPGASIDWATFFKPLKRDP